ncbi:predicted protein [Sclerotinia sclerotiorum 1980 UF-70]|uniref:Rhodopsin domain-containing protein n=1 Tax=Sclerotinia sclerotiorum (strain ATCC 18683 / 1980 / Ss-1) TaxID=665079 RepID=A7ES98_SCLS1|nr:predicted protein [Sclerotinia sclerotiorum 1980 UF-70]EDN92340.1 predicted protein [Sclerotinia sclerotiorum 1980 UF-70]
MAAVTADNHGPLLNVAMWIVLVPMVIATLTKVYIKYDTLRKIQLDDYFGLIAMRVFWTINAAMDALTQVFICLLPIYILSALKLERSKKQLTILLFSPNLLALPLLALRLVYLYETIHSTNYTWDTFNLALVTNLHTSLAIILSCIPFSKSIVDSLTFSPLIITDSTRDTISNRLNNSERGNNSNTGGGSSHFLSCAAARTSTIANVAGGEARELNMYFKFSESQERMISGERA